jgi:hypothetical protein
MANVVKDYYNYLCDIKATTKLWIDQRLTTVNVKLIVCNVVGVNYS